MENRLTVSVSPHIKAADTTRRIMLDVVIALLPALIAAVVHFGWRALLVTLVCVAACVFFEWGFEKIVKRPSTIGDLSAVVTGMLLAFNLPVSIPLWQAVFGCLVAIVAVKQLFGGIGQNFANPAITARIVLMIAFAGSMTSWTYPQMDAVSSATPLALLKAGDAEALPSLLQMLLGQHAGCIGETCALAILLGGAYLLIRRVITWHTPLAFVGTVFVLTAILGREPVYQILSGGLLLGAFFMATDYATTPVTPLGQLVFGVGCGLITVVIRLFGNYPEGVSFSILLMNIVTYISSLRVSRPFGTAEKKRRRISPVLVLVSICLIIAGALALTNSKTASVIAEAERARAEEARQEVLPDADSFTLLEAEDLPTSVTEVYRADNGAGYVFMLEVNGYGGKMKLICGMDSSGHITQCQTLSHEETPSIGSTDGIDTISGATISSRTYIGAIQDAFTAYEMVKEAE